MKKNSGSKSFIKNFIRGGQIVLHNIRMFKQIGLRVFLFVLCFFILIVAAWALCKTTPYEKYIAKEWVTAHFWVMLNHKSQQSFIQPDGETYPVYSNDIIQSPAVINVISNIKSIIGEGLVIGCIFCLLIFSIVVMWLKQRGEKQAQDKHIKGDYLDTPTAVKKLIKKNKIASNIFVADQKIPIPRFSIRQHFLVHGTTGAGKSRLIRQLLDQIRAAGDRALIYDKGCVLIREYYQPELDSLINPLDERTVEWDLWKECRDLAELEDFAAAQIPKSPNIPDPFWVDAARIIFTQAANRLRKMTDKPRLLPLLKYLLTADLNEIRYLLRGTVAETLMSEKIEKTAISIKSILATYLKSLCYVKEGNNPFSISDWVEGKEKTQFLFVSSPSNKHETLKPLNTAWINRAITSLLSLPEDDHRRIWMIKDEFTSLHQLPKVEEGLSEGRKFGGIFVIGIQNYPKLRQVYGNNGAESISGLLNTRFMFRQPDPNVAKWSAINLGETETEEVNESISYGANTIRDGVSISTSDKKKPVVSYSEIMRLNNLECYLRLTGSYPISKITIPYKQKQKISPGFIPRDFDREDLREEREEVERLIDKIKEADKKINPSNKKNEEKELKAKNKRIKKEKKEDKTIESHHALDV